MSKHAELAIIGTGSIGRAIAVGLAHANRLKRKEIILTRRKIELLDDLAHDGFQVQTDNRDAVRRARVILLAVEPQQLDPVLDEIAPELEPDRHLVISIVSGVGIDAILERVAKQLPVVRAMPNTGTVLGRSMTCVAAYAGQEAARDEAVSLFDAVGRTLVIDEEQITPATALCACGTAFFLRAIRAAAQGGIEIGFHPAEALTMAAQTALGAASLALNPSSHPEHEIDNVTTPRGCTISGLNEMEHQGFSSAMIKGITTSAEKARSLYAAER